MEVAEQAELNYVLTKTRTMLYRLTTLYRLTMLYRLTTLYRLATLYPLMMLYRLAMERSDEEAQPITSG